MVPVTTAIAVDLIKTGGFGASAVYRDLDVFPPAASARGGGFCDPWFSAVAVTTGVSIGPDTQLVGHQALAAAAMRFASGHLVF